LEEIFSIFFFSKIFCQEFFQKTRIKNFEYRNLIKINLLQKGLKNNSRDLDKMMPNQIKTDNIWQAQGEIKIRGLFSRLQKVDLISIF